MSMQVATVSNGSLGNGQRVGTSLTSFSSPEELASLLISRKGRFHARDLVSLAIAEHCKSDFHVVGLFRRHGIAIVLNPGQTLITFLTLVKASINEKSQEIAAKQLAKLHTAISDARNKANLLGLEYIERPEVAAELRKLESDTPDVVRDGIQNLIQMTRDERFVRTQVADAAKAEKPASTASSRKKKRTEDKEEAPQTRNRKKSGR